MVANDEKSGLVWIVTQDCGCCAALSWAIIGRPFGALFWRWRGGLDFLEIETVD